VRHSLEEGEYVCSAFLSLKAFSLCLLHFFHWRPKGVPLSSVSSMWVFLFSVSLHSMKSTHRQISYRSLTDENVCNLFRRRGAWMCGCLLSLSFTYLSCCSLYFIWLANGGSLSDRREAGPITISVLGHLFSVAERNVGINVALVLSRRGSGRRAYAHGHTAAETCACLQIWRTP